MITNQISVLFFGQIVDHTKVSSLTMTDIKDTDSVLDRLKSLYPQLEFNAYQIALDKEIIHSNTMLTSNHTLALLPPYAGG